LFLALQVSLENKPPWISVKRDLILRSILLCETFSITTPALPWRIDCHLFKDCLDYLVLFLSFGILSQYQGAYGHGGQPFTKGQLSLRLRLQRTGLGFISLCFLHAELDQCSILQLFSAFHCFNCVFGDLQPRIRRV
jgi:hypothetical protein